MKKNHAPKPVKPRAVAPVVPNACTVCREEPGVVELEVWKGQWSPYCVPCGGSMQSVLMDARGQKARVRSLDPSVPPPQLPPPVIERPRHTAPKPTVAPKPTPKPVAAPKPVAPKPEPTGKKVEFPGFVMDLDDLLGI